MQIILLNITGADFINCAIWVKQKKVVKWAREMIGSIILYQYVPIIFTHFCVNFIISAILKLK